MAGGLEGQLDMGVPDAGLGRLEIHPAEDEGGHAGTAQIVEVDPPESRDTSPPCPRLLM